MGTVNYKGTAVRATATLGLGGVDITQWPILRPEVDTIKTNIMLNAFRIAIQGGLSLFGMIDGIVDEFEDETGVDTAKSQDETYDATGDFYTNSAAQTWAKTLNENTGNFTSTTHSFRQVLAAANISQSGNRVRVTIHAATTNGLTIITASIVERDTGADGATTPTQIFFDGGSAGKTLSSSQSVVSDWADFVVDETKDYLVIIDINSGSADLRRLNTTGDGSYRKISEASYNQQTVTGYTENAGQTFMVGKLEVIDDFSLMANAATAQAQPDEAHLVLFEEDVSATVSENTDLKGWASRDDGRAFTTDFATDDKLDLTAHGFANDDRLTVESSGSLPAGLSAGVLYYVVNKTANDFELALTSGGAAVDITSDGSGTHKVFKWDAVTLADAGNYNTGQRILSGTKDISAQPTGTNMRYLVATHNGKALKLHGAALEWK